VIATRIAWLFAAPFLVPLEPLRPIKPATG
jgi:hypothetical protein